VLRHGIRRSGGFIFLIIFSLIRILGACCQLSTIHHHSIGIYIVVAILDSIGLSPLLLGLVGMISRTYDIPLPIFCFSVDQSGC